MNSSLGNKFGYLCTVLFGFILTAQLKPPAANLDGLANYYRLRPPGVVSEPPQLVTFKGRRKQRRKLEHMKLIPPQALLECLALNWNRQEKHVANRTSRPSSFFWTHRASKDVQSAILCSRCDSRKDNYYGECELSPPTPTQCPENGDSMHCSIVREIGPDGNQLLFARDCATSYLEENCVERNHTGNRLKTVCFRTCDTNGCNSVKLKPRGAASHLQVPFLLIFLTVTLVSFFISRGQLPNA